MEPDRRSTDEQPLESLEYRPAAGLREFVPEDDRGLPLTFAEDYKAEPAAATDATDEPAYRGSFGHQPPAETNGWLVLFASVAMVSAAIGISVAIWSMVPTRPPSSRITAATASSRGLLVARDDAATRRVASVASSASPAPLRQHPPPSVTAPAAAVPGTTVAFAIGPATTRPEPPVTVPPTPATAARPEPPVTVRREAPAPAPGTRALDRVGVDAALDRYRRAFNELDANGVAAVFRGANTAELRRSFSELRHQNVVFDRCDVRTSGPETAVASCVGAISSVATSDAALRRRTASWVFALRRVSGEWQIMGVSSQ